MNIAQVNLQRDYGGAERHVLMLARGLAAKGHTVSVFSHPAGQLGANAVEAGLRVMPLATHRQFNPRALLRLALHLRALRPDVLHFHTPKDYVIGLGAARLAGVPVVVFTRHMLLPVKPYMRGIYDRTSAVVCLSRGIFDNLRNEGISPAKLALIMGAIDLSELTGLELPDSENCPESQRHELRRQLGLTPSDVGIAIVGRLVRGKGHALLLNSFAQLKGEAAKLLIIGDGPLLGNLRQQMAQLGVGEKVVFAGFRDDVPQLMKALDIVVLPSTTAEVLPLSVMEAMAQSRPVVASRVGGVPEIVTNGQHGCLVPPHDATALAEALRKLIHNPRLRVQMGLAGQRRVEEFFSLPRLLAETEHLYQRLLEGD